MRSPSTHPSDVSSRIFACDGCVDGLRIDHPDGRELEDLRVRRRVDLGILDTYAAELADVEEAAVPAALRVPVEEARTLPLVTPEAVLLVVCRHVVRHDVEQDAEAGLVCGLAEPAERGLAAEVRGDLRRVGHVVAV